MPPMGVHVSPLFFILDIFLRDSYKIFVDLFHIETFLLNFVVEKT